VSQLDLDQIVVDEHRITVTRFTIRVRGRLDAVRCPELRTQIEKCLGKSCEQLIIDLSETLFVDSVGLAALVKAMRDANAISTEFALVRPQSDDAMRVFRLSKFDEVFTILDAPLLNTAAS
jgi:anti-sigma B factor antagonist